MKKKIFRNSFLISVLILFLSSSIFCFVMYDHVRDSVYSELKMEAAYAQAGIIGGGEAYLEKLSTERRITLVDADGMVLYDNRADASLMENHLDRIEVADALSKGSGQSVHYSGTTMETTLYYASLLPDGTVLRISAPYENLFSVLGELLRPMLVAVLIILIICTFISSRLSKQITRPINAIDLNDPAKIDVYEELDPLVQRLREQNRTIRSQMDELGRKQREFSAITENVSEGLILLDNRSNILFVNRFALEVLSGGEEIKAVSRSRCRREICEGLENALSGEKNDSIFADGERMLQLISNPVVSMGQVTGAALLVLDVTERVKRDELRREFSANVSHELKTPLTSISGFAELMKEGLVAPEKVQEFSADIYTESRRLIDLIEDIMRLSRLEEGAEEPEFEKVELMSLAESVVSSLRDFADKREVSIELAAEECFVWGSSRILGEMIYNLCENAIKYNIIGGKVYLNISSDKDEKRISVRDTGIGIPQGHQKRIFERFYRVDKSHSKAIGGTGLGLSIVRHGAKFHGAEIEVKSEEGKGSEFIICIPNKGEKK